WQGTAVGGLVQVPINTAYERDFLTHQVRTVQARLAVIDHVYAERFVRVREAAATITTFFVIDTGRGEQARQLLRELGWQAYPGADLNAERSVPLPEVGPRDLAAEFFTSDTTGLSKRVAMPHVPMHFIVEECMSITRFTPQDEWMTVTPL